MASVVESLLRGAEFPVTFVAVDDAGRALQQHVIDYARQRGHHHLWLWSTFGDYYERRGWTPAGEALDYPPPPNPRSRSGSTGVSLSPAR
ncbi:GNAT family acetyltransferase|nr:GNAT family acetyltransferase [Candidatus Pantoea persica]